ncbi:MAG TPA: HypC/HybG/HupF family hydrogenase formation chaperone [Kineosporiaceae bacterium]|nr:HypC/HybG/HupF family hydrogenase formation chaperone [Kineosporiaceae bacterium]
MCLGIPARVTAPAEVSHPAEAPYPAGSDLVQVEMAGVTRLINAGLLDVRPRPGDWVLVHMGFALSTMSQAEADEALTAFTC